MPITRSIVLPRLIDWSSGTLPNGTCHRHRLRGLPALEASSAVQTAFPDPTPLPCVIRSSTMPRLPSGVLQSLCRFVRVMLSLMPCRKCAVRWRGNGIGLACFVAMAWHCHAITQPLSMSHRRTRIYNNESGPAYCRPANMICLSLQDSRRETQGMTCSPEEQT